MTAISSQKQRIIQLMVAGVSDAQIADAVGITPQYLHELRGQDASFAHALEIAQASEAIQSSDRKLNTLEDKVRDRLDVAIDTVVDPMKLARVFQVLNGARRRGAPTQEVGGQHISITLPVTLINNIQALDGVVTDINKQVVKVGDTDLVTIQSNMLDRMVAASKTNVKELSYEDI